MWQLDRLPYLLKSNNLRNCLGSHYYGARNCLGSHYYGARLFFIIMVVWNTIRTLLDIPPPLPNHHQLLLFSTYWCIIRNNYDAHSNNDIYIRLNVNTFPLPQATNNEGSLGNVLYNGSLIAALLIIVPILFVHKRPRAFTLS